MHLFLKFIIGIKLYMFRVVPLSIIRSFSLYTQQLYRVTQKTGTFKNPTKIEEIQQKKCIDRN